MSLRGKMKNMKKALWSALAMLVMTSGAYAVYYALIPETESEKIKKQYNHHLLSRNESKVLNGNISQEIYERKSKEFQISLALAYNREKKPDEAIALIEELISKNSGPPFRLFGRSMPRGSWVYGFDAHYYEMLANAFELKKDIDNRDKATMNKKRALAEEKRLRIIEKSYRNQQ